MSKSSIGLFVVAAMSTVSVFAQQEKSFTVINTAKVGMDSNIYLNESEEDSAEFRDILNLSGKMKFSGRTDAVFSYQPELAIRFDADPKEVSFHDAYAKLNHAASERLFLTLSDHFRYQMRDAQAGEVSRTDANYFNNDLKGSADVSLSEKGTMQLGAGYEMRVWDDDVYGDDLGGNFDHYTASSSFLRDLNGGASKGMVGLEYHDYEYDGDRGSLEVVTIMTGADHTFNSSMTGFGRVGASFTTVDSPIGSEDSSSPYVDAGLVYKPTEKTSFNGSVGYSVYRAETTVFNSQDRLSLGLGVRHDLTAKINLASTISYILGAYESDSANTVGVPDADDTWVKCSLRGSYQINENNFVELGYEFTQRTVEVGSSETEWDRNRVDLGWRLRL